MQHKSHMPFQANSICMTTACARLTLASMSLLQQASTCMEGLHKQCHSSCLNVALIGKNSYHG
jgi:hypothetical protein